MVDPNRVVKSCQRRISLRPLLAFAAAAWIGAYGSPASRAEFILLDNFNAGTIGGALTTSNAAWSANAIYTVAIDPTNPANRVGSAVSASAGNNIFATLPFGAANDIANGSTGTVFFRMMRGQNGTTNFLGYVKDGTTNDTSNRQSGIGSNGGSTGPVYMRGGSANAQVVTSGFTSLPVNTWFRYWVVMDNASDTFTIYSQREGTSPLPQTLLSNSVGATQTFMGTTTTNALRSLLFAQTSGGGSMDYYFDDIYVDPAAANLALPPIAVPEPAGLLTAAAGLALAAAFLRRASAVVARSVGR